MNLHGSYPTSTSSGSGGENRRVCESEERVPKPIDASEHIPGGGVPQAHGAPDEVVSEARALLRLAAKKDAFDDIVAIEASAPWRRRSSGSAAGSIALAWALRSAWRWWKAAAS